MSTKVEVVTLPKRSDATQSEVSVTLPSGSGWQAVAAIPFADAQGAALAVVFDNTAANNKLTYTFSGAGDQATMSNTSEQVFTKKATVPADALAIDDWCEWEAEIFIDGAVSTPAVTGKLYIGTATLESQVIATAAANDYLILRGHGRVSAATTLRAYKGLGETKDGTLSAQTHAAGADVTIQSLGTARDVTASVTSDAGNAGNLATIKTLRFTVYKASTP